MIDYITKNHLGLIIIGWLVISFSLGIGIGTDTVRIVETQIGAINRGVTTISNPFVFEQGVIVQADADGTEPSLTIAGETNASSFIQGGTSLATTTNGAGTFTAAQVCDNTLIVATPNIGFVTLTFPTTAQLVADCLPTIGDTKTIFLSNATTTTGAASVLTLADGANGDHQEMEGGTTLVEGTEWARITFMNIDGTNHLMLVEITRIAD